jgi:hypothetical protein
LADRAFELDADVLSFSFQGGEPTLALLPSFERFVGLGRERRIGPAAPAGASILLAEGVPTNNLC